MCEFNRKGLIATLAPLCNEMPEIMKEERCSNPSHLNRETLFGSNCNTCGLMVCFADDSTMIVANKRTEDNIRIMRNKLNEVSEFLESNELVVNQDKTQTQNFMVRQKHVEIPPDPQVLEVQTMDGVKQIHNKICTRLLGINLHQDLSWRAHFELGIKSLLPDLRKRLGALVHIRKSIPIKGRLMLVNGLLMSKIIYMIPVWGGRKQYISIKYREYSIKRQDLP